jgi:uncharacterized protein (DUF1684 family)
VAAARTAVDPPRLIAFAVPEWRMRKLAAAGRRARLVAAVSVAGACAAPPPPPPPVAALPEGAAYTAKVEAWRAKHDTDYRRDWVSIAGLFPLNPGVNTAGSAATNDIQLPASLPARFGQFVLTGTAVRFEPARGVTVTIKGQPVTAPVVLKDDGAPGADELLAGRVRLVIHVSGQSRSLRVRDPEGPLARGFLGFSWFAIDPAYRVVGRFIPDPAVETLQVPNTFGDLDAYRTEGVVEFTLGGRSLRLRPFTTRPKRLYFVFKDASSGVETYEAARFVYADLLDDGTAVVDFNEAYNPPCAFNPYTTCPIPLKENHLPVKILAGEKAYPVKVPAVVR